MTHEQFAASRTTRSSFAVPVARGIGAAAALAVIAVVVAVLGSPPSDPVAGVPSDGPIRADSPSPRASAVEPSASSAHGEPSASPAGSALPGTLSVLESREADALFAKTDTCTNPRAGYTVTFPDDWYTNTAVDDVAACSWFTPEFFEVETPGERPDEIWISMGLVDAAFGYTSLTEVISSEEVVVGGHAARRVEYNPAPVDAPQFRAYHYVIPFGDVGPTFVAETDIETADDHELAKAVLDRLMASLQFADAPTIPTEPTGPLIDGSPVTTQDDDGTFRLTLTAGQGRYRAGQAIDVDATLTYLGPHGAIVARGSGNSLIGFGIESRDLPLRVDPIYTSDCAPHDFVRGEPMRAPFAKSGGFTDGDPFAPFYRSYFASPELRLPAGTWTITAHVSLSIGDCGEDIHDLSTSIMVVVEP